MVERKSVLNWYIAFVCIALTTYYRYTRGYILDHEASMVDISILTARV